MENCLSSNVNSSDIDEETKTKLKGDNIGATLYSESFVLKTLLKLNDMNTNWDEQLDEDLCFLWDMTTEKDVCEYLSKVNFPTIAYTVLTESTSPRLTEIVIGTYSNLLTSNCLGDISDLEFLTVFHMIDTRNISVLIQTMRYIQSFTYAYPNKISLITRDLMNRIKQILTDTSNIEPLLIINTLKAVDALLYDMKLETIEVNSDLYSAIVSGFDSIQPNSLEVELDSEETNKLVTIFLRIVSSVCAYINKDNENNISFVINDCQKLSVTIHKLLKYFSKEKNLVPVTDDFMNYISFISCIFTTNGVTMATNVKNGNFSQIFYPLCKILFHLHAIQAEIHEVYKMTLDLIAFIIYSVEKHIVLIEFKKIRYR